MAGNTKGGETLRKTMIAKHGSIEAWKAHMREIAARGGQKTGVEKGFAANRELARIAGTKGGSISRRRKRNEV